MGGGAWACLEHSLCYEGPFPRRRGSHTRAVVRVLASGSIPAWAREPCRPCFPACRQRVHPRVGGGAHPPLVAVFALRGLSPRARVHRPLRQPQLDRHRFIPAWIDLEVHPRMRGRTTGLTCQRLDATGSSPHARVIRIFEIQSASGEWFIPACAGATGGTAIRLDRGLVHPRMRGVYLSSYTLSCPTI